MKILHFSIICALFSLFSFADNAVAQDKPPVLDENIKSEAFNALFTSVLDDSNEIILQDEDFIQLYCAEKKECSLKYSELIKKLEQHYDADKQNTWGKTDCGVPFSVKVFEYDCGSDNQPDMIIRAYGLNEFDCVDYDDSGHYAFIHRGSDNKYYLTQTWNDWRYNPIEIQKDSEYQVIATNGLGLGNFSSGTGKIDANCKIQPFYSSLTCSNSCYEGMSAEDVFCAEYHKDGKVYMGFCWEDHPELLRAWKKYCDRLEIMISGVMKFKEPLSFSVKSGRELGIFD